MDGWRCETALPGRRATPDELVRSAPSLRRVHALTRRLPQRPGWPRALSGPFAHLAAPEPLPACVIHGDLNPGNVLIHDGRAGLVDWEEARRDDPALDLAALGATVSGRARRAYLVREIALCWQPEPERARRLSGLLVRSGRPLRRRP